MKVVRFRVSLLFDRTRCASQPCGMIVRWVGWQRIRRMSRPRGTIGAGKRAKVIVKGVVPLDDDYYILLHVRLGCAAI
jgi:hypothetical protein